MTGKVLYTVTGLVMGDNFCDILFASLEYLANSK